VKIKKTRKIVLADKILKAVNENLKNHKSVKIDGYDVFHPYLEAYCNGREQGLCIASSSGGTNWACSFSEHRSSDSIVVYVGEFFDMAGNVPSANASSEYFSPAKATYINDAGKYIADQIIRAEQKAVKWVNDYKAKKAVKA
jgi:hypothetical protein